MNKTITLNFCLLLLLLSFNVNFVSAHISHEMPDNSLNSGEFVMPPIPSNPLPSIQIDSWAANHTRLKSWQPKPKGQFMMFPPSCIEADSLELVAFYNATGGDDWTDNSGWLVDNVEDWFGVTLSEDGCGVERLEMFISLSSGNNLIGTISNLTLPILKELDLRHNQLSGEIPNFNLPNLERLQLHYNDLTGEIPDFNLPNLENLELHYNDLTGGIPNFANLPFLEQLILRNNDLGGEIPDFSNFPNLRNIILINNNLTGEIPDLNLPSLRTLSIGSNNLTGEIPDFSNLSSISGIGASWNFLSGIPDFSDIPTLKSIVISANDLTGEIPDFSNLPVLEELDLSENILTGSIPNFSSLPLLESLDLNSNQLSDSIPNFSDLPLLEELFLQNNDLTSEIPNFCCIPLLQELSLRGNELSGQVPNFSNLPNIFTIEISYNSLNENIPNFSDLPNIQELHVGGNEFVFSNILNVWDLISNLPNCSYYNSELNYCFSYNNQSTIPLNQSNNTLYAEVGGMTDNHYTWFKEGTELTTVSGDSSLVITESGNYYVQVTNDIVTNPDITEQNLILTSEELFIEFLPPPSNDNCSDAISLDPLVANQEYGVYTNVVATADSESDCIDFDNNVWFSFTGTGSVIFVDVYACGDEPIPTTYEAAFYRGTGCENWENFACTSAEGEQTGLDMGFSTDANLTYFIAVDGDGITEGEFCIEITGEETCTPDPNSSILVTTTEDNGNNDFPIVGSLRAAIKCANETAGANDINFNLTGTAPFIFNLPEVLPQLTDDATIIDATTQTDFVLGDIIIDGTDALINGEDGFDIQLADGIEIYGLVIRNFPDDAIRMSGASNITIKNNILIGNGTNSTHGNGVYIEGNSELVTIQNNYIGYDPINDIAAGNSREGIQIQNSFNITIGGIDPTFANVIAGNGEEGIWIHNSSNNIDIRYNYIGTNDTQTDLGNSHSNIFIQASTNIEIDYNTITFSENYGIEVESTANEINLTENSIFCNNNGGIFMETGGNLNENTPTITLATPSSIEGTGQPSETVEVFIHNHESCLSNSTCQGKLCIGSTTSNVSTGDWFFDLTSSELEDGIVVTATSTNSDNNTSEFSTCATVTASTCSPDDNGNIYVTTLADNGDDDNPIAGSLRAAIICANETIGANHIYLDTDAIATDAPYTIQPLTELPSLTDAETYIDFAYTGSTSTGYVELDGSLLDSSIDIEARGLTLQGDNCEICAFYIHSFPDDGVLIDGCDGCKIGSPGKGNIIAGNGTSDNAFGEQVYVLNANNIDIVDNRIGTSVNGEDFSLETAGNASEGIYVGNSTNITIGGDDANWGNTISGNTGNGIWINGSEEISVKNNYIGVSANGGIDVGNQGCGVRISNSSNTTIDSKMLEDNLISGNGGSGIIINENTNNCVIQNNKIGTDITGSFAIGNGENGIKLDNAYFIYIQGENLISGNGGDGIDILNYAHFIEITDNKIGTDITGISAIANNLSGIRCTDSNLIYIGGGFDTGTDIAGNTISGNGEYGVRLDEDNSIVYIQGNYIGLDDNGTSDLGNTLNGVYIHNSSSTSIGGTADISRNYISGNNTDGIYLWGEFTNNNLIQNNHIGLNINGGAVGNTNDGIVIADNVQGTVIEGNVVSGNGATGIWVNNFASGTSIAGNKIGTTIDGTGDLGNGFSGIALQFFSSSTTIGGNEADDRNIISGNGHNGIWIGEGVNDASILNNYIGTDITGTTAIPNTLDGILIEGGSGIIGGTGQNEGNIISGNEGSGVYILGSPTTATGTLIRNNWIGLNSSGEALGNTANGVVVDNAQNTVIEEGNVISDNGDSGIWVTNFSSNTFITGNKIGTNVAGTVGIGNGNDGIAVENNAAHTVIGGGDEIYKNLISGNTASGILVGMGVNNTTIGNNYIGTNLNGTDAIPNTGGGIYIDGATQTYIGEKNLISGNSDNGIIIRNAANIVEIMDNKIGTDANGTNALGNQMAGIDASNVSNLLIFTNLISDNVEGIQLGSNIDFVSIEDNKIGTNIDGTLALGNEQDGININGAIGVFIVFNLISGNGEDGIDISFEGNQTYIESNKIGTDITGTIALGNLQQGIEIDGSKLTEIQNNLISGNGFQGIFIENESDSTYIYQNKIGTDQTGLLDLGNGLEGIGVSESTHTFIGSETINFGNTIAYNSEGIEILGASDHYNIRRNSMFCNGLGITGSSVNPPTVQTVNEFTIEGECTANAIIELFLHNDTGCNGVPCQGKTFIGSTTADSDGNWSLSSSNFTQPITAGQNITATATFNGNTSEFTECLQVCPQINPVIAGETAFCEGETTTLTANDFSDFTAEYFWSTGESGQEIEVNTGGIYTITVTDGGVCSGTASIEVIQNANPFADISAGDETFCSGTELDIFVHIPTNSTLVWSNDDETQLTQITEGGTYTVTVTDENNCSTTSSVFIEELPQPNPEIVGDFNFCEGETKVLALTEAYVDYLWSTGSTDPSIEVSEGGVYSVSVSDGNICVGTTSIEVVVDETPTLTIGLPEGSQLCIGNTLPLTANSNASDAEYEWSTGQSGPDIEVSEGGVYAVTVIHSNGCSNTASILIEELIAPSPSIGGELNFCTGESTVLSTGNAFQSYLWSDGSQGFSIEVTAPGDYSLTVTNANGCSGTEKVTVVENELPIAFIEGENKLCDPSILLSVAQNNEGFTYEWSTGVTSEEIVVDETGTYAVTVTDTNGCSAMDDHIVEDCIVGCDVVADFILQDTICTSVFLTFEEVLTENTTMGGTWEVIYPDGTVVVPSDFLAFPDIGTYTVTYFVESTSDPNCNDTHSDIIYAGEPAFPSWTLDGGNNDICETDLPIAIFADNEGGYWCCEGFEGCNATDESCFTLIDGQMYFDPTGNSNAVESYELSYKTSFENCKSHITKTVNVYAEPCDCPDELFTSTATCPDENGQSIITIFPVDVNDTYIVTAGDIELGENVFEFQSGSNVTVTLTSTTTDCSSSALIDLPTDVPILSLDNEASQAVFCGEGSIVLTPTGLDEGGTYHYYLDSEATIPANPASGDSWVNGEIVGQRIIYIIGTTANGCKSAPMAISTYSYEDIVVSNLTTTCNDSDNSYAVSFDISGGNGVYTVDGVEVGDSFISEAIPQGEDYSFVIDDSPLLPSCEPLTVSGLSPDCLSDLIAVDDFVFTSPGETAIFNILANDMGCDISVGGLLTAPSCGQITDFNAQSGSLVYVADEDTECTEDVFVYEIVDCTGATAVATVTIYIAQENALEVEVIRHCEGAEETGTYELEVIITGGTPPFTISGNLNEVLSDYGSTSAIITDGNPYAITVMDADGNEFYREGGFLPCVKLASCLDSIIVNGVLCPPDYPKVVLSAITSSSFEFTYEWSTGESTQSIEVTEAGTYSVTVLNTDGCGGSSSIEVVEDCSEDCDAIVFEPSNIQLNGNAQTNSANSNCWKLTDESTTAQAGSIWSQQKVSLNQPFILTALLNTSSDSSDGFTFTLHKDALGLAAIGAHGEGLGYGPNLTDTAPTTVQPSVGIEIDTYQNPIVGDPAFNHIAVNENGNMESVTTPVMIPDFGEGLFYELKVVWNPTTFELTYYFDGELKGVYEKDLVTEIFGGETNVYWGFTAATGGGTNIHQVCDVELTNCASELIAVDDNYTTCTNIPITFNPTENDLGECFDITGIIVNGSNITLEQIGTTVTYTPEIDFVGSVSYEYIITDCFGQIDTALVTIEVIEAVPIEAVDDIIHLWTFSDATPEDDDAYPTSFNILENDTGQNIKLVNISLPDFEEGGTVTLYYDPNVVSTAIVPYDIIDEKEMEASADLFIYKNVHSAIEKEKAVDLVGNILGECVPFENAKITGRNTSYAVVDSNQIENLKSIYELTMDYDQTSFLAFQSGVLLSTGNVYNGILSPNTVGSLSTDNSLEGDADLMTDDTETFDATTLEFDFTAISESISFRYWFGSEEYPEWEENNFQDRMAIFISGGEFTEPINIATLEDGTAVGVETINQDTNSEFFQLNEYGALPQYDGLTIPLETIPTVLTVGETYHIKIVIADVGNAEYDSGLFIETAETIEASTIEAVNDTIHLWTLANPLIDNAPYVVSFNILENDKGDGIRLVDVDYDDISLGEDMTFSVNGTVVFHPTEGEAGMSLINYTIEGSGCQNSTVTSTATIQIHVHPYLEFLDEANKANQMVGTILGTCVPYTNVTLTGAPMSYSQLTESHLSAAESHGLTDINNLPFTEGILLSTGNALDGMMSPNTTGSLGTNNYWEGDTDLMTDTTQTFDATSLEFDFTAVSESLGFRYWFGSEEYPEWIESSFKDRMAILISGGEGQYINPVNIAVLPDTDPPVPVGVETVNHIEYNQYYTSNADGALPQYDGMVTTMPLEATATNLIVGETYHIKIVIADVGDAEFDSGLFIEANMDFNDMEFVVSEDATINLGESLTLSAEVLNTSAEAIYNWTPSESLDNPNIANPTAMPTETTTYMVTATIGDCMFTSTVTIVVNASSPCEDLSAGTLSTIAPYVCFEDNIGGTMPIEASDFMLREGDVLGYILQNENGVVLAYRSDDANFSFEEIEAASYNTEYFVMAVAGLNNGSGEVDLGGECVSRSNSFPVVFLEDISISTTIVCENNEQYIEVVIGGGLPAYLDSESYELVGYESPIFEGETVTIGAVEGIEILEVRDGNSCSADVEVNLYELVVSLDTIDGEEVTNNTIILDVGETRQLWGSVNNSENPSMTYTWSPIAGFGQLLNINATEPDTITHTLTVDIDNLCSLQAEVTVIILPTAYDCSDAIIPCNNEPILYNSNGEGIEEILETDKVGCLAEGEHYSTWIRLQIDDSTPANEHLTFEITPNDGQRDYDFNLYRANSCSNLEEPIRCSFAPTSMESVSTGLNETDTDESDIDNGFASYVEVNGGEIYYLLIDNFGGNAQGFTLEWTNPNVFFNCDTIPECLAEGGVLSLDKEVYCDEENIEVSILSYYPNYPISYKFMNEEDSTFVNNPTIGRFCVVSINRHPDVDINGYMNIKEIEEAIEAGVCISLSNMACFEIFEVPEPPTFNSSYCDHEVFHIEVDVLADADIRWYSDEGLTNEIWEGNGIHIDTAGTYFVTQTLNDCESEALEIVVTEADLNCEDECLAEEIQLFLDKEVYCDEENIVVTTLGGYAEYSWSYLFLSADSMVIDNPTIGDFCMVIVNRHPDIDMSDYGSIEEIETGIAGGVCMAMSNIVCFEVLDLPPSPTFNSSYCDHQVFHIEVDILTDASIRWYSDEELTNLIEEENGIHIDEAGTYYVTQTLYDCESEALEIEVTEADLVCLGECPDNLVQNFSFEEHDEGLCAFLSAGDILVADLWYPQIGAFERADYFNECNSGNYNVPEAALGFQDAFEGNAYVGAMAYDESDNDLTKREYIQTQLTSTLIEGQSYCVSMQVSLADNSQFAIDNMGIYFSANQITGSDIEAGLEPQIVHQGFLEDTDEWMEVKGTFTATAGLQNLAIGNFGLNSGVKEVNPAGNGEAYYYIDRIEVRPTNEIESLLAFDEEGEPLSIVNNTIVICPNDAIRLEATTTASTYLCDLGWFEASSDTLSQMSYTVQPTESETVFHFWVSNGLCEVADSLVVIWGDADDEGDCALSVCPEIQELMNGLEDFSINIPYQMDEIEVDLTAEVGSRLFQLVQTIEGFDEELLADFEVNMVAGSLQTEANSNYIEFDSKSISYNNSTADYAYMGQDEVSYTLTFPSCGTVSRSLTIHLLCPEFEVNTAASDCVTASFRLSDLSMSVSSQTVLNLLEISGLGWSIQYKIEDLDDTWRDASNDPISLEPNTTYTVLIRMVKANTNPTVPIFDGSYAEICGIAITTPSLGEMQVGIAERCLEDGGVELTVVTEGLEGSDNFEFEWSTGETTQQIVLSPPFDPTYWVDALRISDGCRGIDSIFQVGPPNVFIEYSDKSRCVATIGVRNEIPQNITCHNQTIPEEDCWWNQAEQVYKCEINLLETSSNMAYVVVSDFKGCADSVELFTCKPEIHIIKPNPSKGLFTIELIGIPIQTPIGYQVYGTDGSVVLNSENIGNLGKQPLDNWRTVTIDLDDRFGSGIYFVRFFVEGWEGDALVKRLVKED